MNSRTTIWGVVAAVSFVTYAIAQAFGAHIDESLWTKVAQLILSCVSGVALARLGRHATDEN